MATTAFVSSNGNTIRWEIPVTNNGSQPDTNVTVTGAYPAGVLYTIHDPVAGTTFTPSTPEWVIPTLGVGDTKTLVVYTVVTDITLAPFVWTLTVDGDNVDPVAGNNELVLTVETTTCPPSAGAVDDPNACLCGNVTTNDTLCSSGTTEIRLDSTENLDETFEIGVDGSYNTNGQILDPFSEASFTYSIWCIIGEDEYETSGPATVTIPPMFGSAFTDSVQDNEDGTFTHTALNGDEVTWNAGWTTVEEGPEEGEITFTYPDGTQVVISLNGGQFVESVTGNFVNNSDPLNPSITVPIYTGTYGGISLDIINATNVATYGIGTLHYQRVIDVVTVFGSFAMTPTAPGPLSFDLPLIIPSTWNYVGDCAGSFTESTGISTGAISGVTNDHARFTLIADGSETGFKFSLNYKIIG